ncbi:MAG: CBS domain-containing protein [Candidatus Brocadiia bacterium]
MANAKGDFIHLSAIVGRKVFLADHTVLGRVKDLAVDISKFYPPVVSLAVGSNGKLLSVSWTDFSDKTGYVLKDGVTRGNLPEFKIGTGQLLLDHQILDKQILDMSGVKLVRVNDCLMLGTDTSLLLTHVEVGFRGFLRRLGFEKPFVDFVKWLFGYDLRDELVPWREVHVIPVETTFYGQQVKFEVMPEKLTKLNPAQLADVLEELGVEEQKAMIESLEPEDAADVLEQASEKVQVNVISAIDTETAADIVEEMSQSEAVDVIASMDDEKAMEILSEMEREDAEDMQELLEHHEDSAGGHMTTAYMAVKVGTKIVDAVASFRSQADELDVWNYIYVIDEPGHLVGVASIRELLAGADTADISTVASAPTLTFGPETPVSEVAESFKKYGIRGVPVVDDSNKLIGVVAFKNLMESAFGEGD